jgi:type IV secretion system protein VirD4
MFGKNGGGRIGAGLNLFQNFHRQSMEADFAARARANAARTQWQMMNAKPSGQLGDSKLADGEDAGRAGLHDPRGLFLGAHLGRMLFWNSDESLLTFLRTGGGKGVCLIQPNLAHVSDRSLVIIDAKNGELAWSTSEHREKILGQKCIFINPYGLHGLPNTRLNPLQLLINIVASGGVIDGQADGIAHILVPQPKSEGDNAWVRKGAIELLVLRMEFLAKFDPDNCKLSGLWRFMNGGTEHFALAFSLMSTCGDESIERRAMAFDSMRFDAPKQWEAIRSEAAAAVYVYEPTKSLGKATDAHDFDLTRLKQEKIAVFLILSVNNLDHAAPFASSTLNLIIETLAATTGPVRTTFILDEFPNFPKVSGILRSLRLHRSLGIQFWFFAQGRHSMTGKWSKDEIKEIEDQVGCTLMKSVWEPDLLKDITLWSGNKTILSKGVSHNGGTVETGASNLGETKRPVLQTEDILNLGSDKFIIRVASMPRLLIADAVPYFKVTPWKDQVRDVRDLHSGKEEE